MNTQFKPDLIDQFEGARAELFHPGSTFVSALTGLWSVLERARERRRASAALRSFDDRMLRDIGVSRWEIEYMVRHGRRTVGGD
jgi:uncharacterized protein YjiS (DUF1127 family)